MHEEQGCPLPFAGKPPDMGSRDMPSEEALRMVVVGGCYYYSISFHRCQGQFFRKGVTIRCVVRNSALEIVRTAVWML